MFTLFTISICALTAAFCLMVSRSVIYALFASAFAGLFLYLTNPVLALDFFSPYFYVFVIFAATSFIGMLIAGLKGSGEPSNNSIISFCGVLLAGVLFVIVIPLGVNVLTHVFGSEDYRTVLEKPMDGVFETDVEQIDQSQVRTVDQSLAVRRAEELLGAEMGLGSRVNVGKMSIQSIGGKLYWIAPLVHSGFFKWFTNETTPGYMKVSATNIRDAEIVLDHEFSYGKQGFYFSNNIHRHLWMNGNKFSGLADFTLELDDEENPWWVVPLYKHTVGFSGAKVTGVAIVNPETGDIQRYDLDEIPEWVDRVQPEDFMYSQLTWWGKYVHGFWNSLFAKKDVVNPTAGMSLVYSNDGRAMWYTGIQTSGQNQGTQGFMLIDTRTGKPTFYRKSGVTETGAKDAIEGKVSNYTGYHATNPILYNVSGEPVFVATIKDGSGNFKMIGAVSAQDRSVVVIGDTVRSALREFSSSLMQQSYSSSLDTGALAETFSGRVSRIGQEVNEEGSQWYIMLSEHPEVAFTAPSGLPSPLLPLTQPGDRMQILAVDTGRSVLSAESIENLDIGDFQRSRNQEKAKARDEAVEKKHKDDRNRQNLEAKIKNLTPEETKAILRELHIEDEE